MSDADVVSRAWSIIHCHSMGWVPGCHHGGVAVPEPPVVVVVGATVVVVVGAAVVLVVPLVEVVVDAAVLDVVEAAVVVVVPAVVVVVAVPWHVRSNWVPLLFDTLNELPAQVTWSDSPAAMLSPGPGAALASP
jgi:hypothetical protein